ncbi:hypothetical protein [Streptomyces anulatus]|uniref:hypothetical protein n=1 Tax=Streptomyces anulatus TaxID=1892 RepID=UPI003F4A5525
MTDYLTAVMEMLGPASNRYADPAAWDRLHAELGMELPADYQALVDGYAPIQLNGHLYLCHPAAERWNLGQKIRDTVRAWSETPWDDLDPDEDPRLLFELEELSLAPATDYGRSPSPTEARQSFSWLRTMQLLGSWSRTARAAGHGTT